MNSIFALSCRYKDLSKRYECYYNGDEYYLKAKSLVDIFMDFPSLETVQSLIFLTIYAAGSGRARYLFEAITFNLLVF